MRTTLLATVSILTLSLGNAAVAASAEDAAYDKGNRPVIDSNGKCVRTMWQDVNDPCAPAPKPVPRPVVVAPAPAPMPVITTEQRTVYFDFDSAKLDAEDTTKLDQLALIINQSAAITNVSIHGFTDQLGTNAYNEALAHKRAAAVKQYLDSKSRLAATEGDIRGLGKSAPEAQCEAMKKHDEKVACMATERRVEVVFNAQK